MAIALFCVLPQARGQGALQQLQAMAPAGASTGDSSVAAGQKAGSGQDLSQEYLAAWELADAAFGDVQIAELKRYKVLFVPGFFSNHYRVYFTEQMDWLRAIGVDCEKVGINTEASVQDNAAVVARAIAASDKPVIIVSHSKGSVDALAALISNSELPGKVKGWVSIQGAWLGSPIADYVSQHLILGTLASAVLKVLGGSPECMADLTTGAAADFIQKNKDAIQGVVHAVPLIAFASWKDAPSLWPRGLMEFTGGFMYRQGIKNDGLLPSVNSLLPGADYVLAANVDHADPVMPSSAPFDRMRLTKTLLAMLLRRVGPGLK